jgi:hypothetical protein
MDQKPLDKNWKEGESEFWQEVRTHVREHKPDRLAKVDELRQFIHKRLADPNSGFDLFFHRSPIAVAESIEAGGYQKLDSTDRDGAPDASPQKLAERHPELKRFIADE